MKITIITDTWEPQINGVVTTIKNIIEELSHMGHTVNLISPDKFRTIKCPTDNEIKISLFPKSRMLKLFSETDAIHIANEGPLGFSAKNICIKRKLPFTTAFHTSLPEYIKERMGIPTCLTYGILRRFHHHSKCIMVPTKSIQNKLISKRFSNLKQWTRGVDTSMFKPMNVDLGLKKPIHLYVGRIAKEKNIEAFLKLPLQGSKIIVGNGPMLETYKKKYKDVYFTGIKTGIELVKFYAGSDVFVFPSKTDTFGLVQIESLACGTPVASFPSPGPIDILNDKVGHISDNLSLSIKEALKKSRDECRKYSLKYSWRKCAESFLENLYWI